MFLTDLMGTDKVRVKAKKIAAVLNTLSASARSTGDWSAFASSGTLDHAAYRPLLDLSAVRNEIFANYVQPDTIVSNDRTYNYYMSNPDITPLMQTPWNSADTVAGTVPAPGLPGVQWFIDQASIADNILFYYNRQAVFFFQGPSRSSSYREEIPGGNGMMPRGYHTCGLYQSGFGKKLSHLHNRIGAIA